MARHGCSSHRAPGSLPLRGGLTRESGLRRGEPMLQTLIALTLGTASAGDPPAAPAPAPAPATAPAPAPECAALTGDAKATCEKAAQLKLLNDELTKLGDCTKLTGDAKTQCDTKSAELKA